MPALFCTVSEAAATLGMRRDRARALLERAGLIVRIGDRERVIVEDLLLAARAGRLAGDGTPPAPPPTTTPPRRPARGRLQPITTKGGRV